VKEEKMRGAPRVDVVMKISDSLVREERCDLSQRKLQFVRPIISRASSGIFEFSKKSRAGEIFYRRRRLEFV